MLRQHLRTGTGVLLRWALQVIDAVGSALSRLDFLCGIPGHGKTSSGISVVIPERANAGLLGECLASVTQAARQVEEPVEVVVVVNGSGPDDYRDLCRRYKSVKWVFYNKPLWFNGAIRKGLRFARHDWVYLLNSDMLVDPMALSELLRWRAPHVFAIASQIFFAHPSRRREETGWTQFRSVDDRIEIFDATPEEDRVRGTFYAGGGASLFQKSLLKRVTASTGSYRPFYWEDVEWGTVAWRMGFESLFCPRSIVRHHQRATNRLFFPAGEIDRVFHRNMVLYELRNRVLEPALGFRVFEWLRGLDRLSWLEIMKPGSVAGILWSRLKYWIYPYREMPLQCTWLKYYTMDWSAVSKRPMVLVVTPYMLYPPSHGGAVRLHKLLAGMSNQFHVVLLSDEADRYGRESRRYFGQFSAVHLVKGRVGDSDGGRMQRINSHCHSGLKTALRMLLDNCAPALVQVEFSELTKLCDLRTKAPPWLLSLHEVWISGRGQSASEEDRRQQALLNKFDTVIACSEEDAQLIDHPDVRVVPNGADVQAAYVPSPDSGPILFLGPFRYLPNLLGIREFLETVYPFLLQSIPGIRLSILGGDGAAEIASRMPCFSQAGITVMGHVDQPRLMLDRCVLTINPLRGVRGSCLKVAESFAAGRVCISTTDGARGFLQYGTPGLIAVDSVAAFQEPIKQLFLDADYRRSIELPSREVLKSCSWENSAQKTIHICSDLIASGSPAGH